MAEQKNLYFIALLPPADITRHVDHIKNEIARNYNCKDALKPPTHITMEAPFFASQNMEHFMRQKLRSFANTQFPFRIQFSGYGAFPDHTIFIDVKESKPLKKLHRDLSRYLTMELNFNRNTQRSSQFKPHMTVAYRDLKQKFHQVWKDYKNRTFEANFLVESLFLLKHNYSHWEILEELRFDRSGFTMNLFEHSYGEKVLAY
ncbi:2'-5' RNA ligase family protein [Fulvivirgaceae bacterium BMA10]|uniref:2'-5' RNA ligase family protein n=1 Tax=Splendidivirga corallicola TaxID=3051826 RepID=A0ABT8KGM3_9BACT|nr:2'-5' RNA ligase family protein [Fulvivirgaceae bacterium BMA10]